MDSKIVKLSEDAILPTYATNGSAGFDLYALEDVLVKPQETVFVKTGLSMEIPEDMAVMIYPRSGVSAKTTLRLANGVGVIDSDYRGEVKLIMFNSAAPSKHQVPQYTLTDGQAVDDYSLGYNPSGTCLIKKGDRIAQGVLQDITQADFKIVKEHSENTTRGKDDFGSSGKQNLDELELLIEKAKAHEAQINKDHPERHGYGMTALEAEPYIRQIEWLNRKQERAQIEKVKSRCGRIRVMSSSKLYSMSPEDLYLLTEQKILMRRQAYLCRARMTPQEMEIYDSQYLDELSQQKIANKFNVSQPTVSRILKVANEKIDTAIREDP